MIYLNLWESCQKKSKVLKKGLIVRLMVIQEMNSKCQIDLNDMQSQPGNDFKLISVYQDRLMKFVQLCALNKRAKNFTHHLIYIFLYLESAVYSKVPAVRSWVNEIVKEACVIWPDLKILHGKCGQSQTQRPPERANQDVENMLSYRLESNQTIKGSRFLQLIKNRAFHEGTICTLYEVLFGTNISSSGR